MLTRGQVAVIFGVAPNTVSRWSREGKLPCVRTLGGQRRYVEAQVFTLAERLGIHPGRTLRTGGGEELRHEA